MQRGRGNRLRGGGGNGFSPLSLFAAGEQGGWYDPSDFSALFQDSAGTTPVTATTQPVGLVLDKHINSVTHSTNCGAKAQSFGGGGASTISVSNNTITFTAAAANDFVSFSGGGEFAGTEWPRCEVRFSVVVTSGAFVVFAGSSASATISASGSYVASTINSNNGTFSLQANAAATSAVVTIQSITGYPGNHIKQATAANRPTLQQDAGGYYYLAFNGTNSCMQSAATVSMSGSDKATLWTAVRRSSDATLGVVSELSALVGATNPGSFVLHSSDGGPQYLCAMAQTGTNQKIMSGATAAPASDVISYAMDFAQAGATEIGFMLNGGSNQTGSGTDAGTGNFGNYTLNIGSRNAGSFFFNGSMYQTVLRGTLSTALQIAQGTTFVAKKMGVVL